MRIAAVVLAGLWDSVAGAQTQGGPLGLSSDQVRALEGKKVLSVRVVGVTGVSENVVLSQLTTRSGRPLAAQNVADDLAHLWTHFKLQARVFVAIKPDGVHVRFAAIKEFFRYDRTVFRGLDHFTVEQVRGFLELDGAERIDELTAASLAQRLMDRYRRDGYANVNVRTRTDRESSTLTFLVDEGPRAHVRSIRFRGNKAFPARSLLGLTWNLLGSAGIKSTPGLFGNAPFSAQTLRDDLDRLRGFYRGRGYKDAVVELYKLDFSDDFREVDIVVRIFEGELYRVEAVDVRVEPFEGEVPLFTREELLEVIELKPDDPVTQSALERDRLQLSLFYGRRGFPSWEEHRALDRESSFRVLDPVEIVDPERSRVTIVYAIKEGKRKRLRAVNIRGNRFTRDPVIRREVSVAPGEFVDMEELAKSRDRLLDLRYFGDFAVGDPGVRLRLKPVENDPELVDLDIDVTEGRTGQILWGVGVSSNAGLFGNIQYNKRNFDWKRPPASLNPIEWFRQVLDNEAFHGGGQTLNLDVAPGTEVSQASVSFFEPDLFGTHIDMIGLGLDAFRRLRRFDTYDQDNLGGRVRFVRRFGRDVSVGFTFTHDRVQIDDIAADAPAIVWDAEGTTSITAIGGDFSVRDLDRLIQPSSGYRVRGSVRVAPEWLGGQATFWRAGLATNVYLALHRDSRNRAHVLEVRNSLQAGGALGDDEDLFLTERFFMGGQGTLRGFDFRRAGPTQFGRPTGGELRYLGSMEYSFPVFSTRPQGVLEETELIRGVFFLDGGMLGGDFGDPLFRQLRLTAGFGVRIRIPGLGGLPIALDFGWPLMREATDRLEVFSFTFRFN